MLNSFCTTRFNHVKPDGIAAPLFLLFIVNIVELRIFLFLTLDELALSIKTEVDSNFLPCIYVVAAIAVARKVAAQRKRTSGIVTPRHRWG